MNSEYQTPIQTLIIMSDEEHSGSVYWVLDLGSKGR